MKNYLKILGEQKRPFRFLISLFYWYSGLCRLININFGSYKLRFHPTTLSRVLWTDRTYGQEDCDIIKQLLHCGETYVDVGANIGQLVIEGALAVGAEGHVFAFEAHPRTAQFLRINISLNGLENVAVAQTAVGNTFKWVSFSDEKCDDQNKVSNKGIQVPMVKLEPFLENRKIKLLKIDVEGFEKYVLEGLGESHKFVDIIYFEVMDAHFDDAGYSFSDLFEILERFGFSTLMLKNGAVRFVRRDELFRDCINLFAVRNIEEFCERMNVTSPLSRGVK